MALTVQLHNPKESDMNSVHMKSAIAQKMALSVKQKAKDFKKVDPYSGIDKNSLTFKQLK